MPDASGDSVLRDLRVMCVNQKDAATSAAGNHVLRKLDVGDGREWKPRETETYKDRSPGRTVITFSVTVASVVDTRKMA